MKEDAKFFAVSWLSKEDLVHCQPDQAERIQHLDDDEMQYIADKLGESIMETYWMALEIILQDYLKGDLE